MANNLKMRVSYTKIICPHCDGEIVDMHDHVEEHKNQMPCNHCGEEFVFYKKVTTMFVTAAEELVGED